MGILLITLGIVIAIAVLFLTTKVVGGPWSFGFSLSLIFTWVLYILFQIVLPLGLIMYGISIL